MLRCMTLGLNACYIYTEVVYSIRHNISKKKSLIELIAKITLQNPLHIILLQEFDHSAPRSLLAQ